MPATPNLFIVGQPKSGTSALFSYLRQHPEVIGCNVKEPQYFCDDINSQYFYLSKTDRTENNYLALYSEAEARYYLEASTAYLYSRVAAQNIYEFNPNARIIIMLREPVDFLYTYHRQLLRNSCKFEVETNFLKALDLETDRRAGRKLPNKVFDEKYLFYSERVKYLEHILRFENLFKKEQIKIILFDDLKRDTRQVFLSVLDFLELDASHLPDFNPVNKQVAVRSRVLKQTLDKVFYPIKSWSRKNISRDQFDQLRSLYRSVIFSARELPSLDKADIERLKVRYVEEVARLSEHLGRDLINEWAYRQAGELSNKE